MPRIVDGYPFTVLLDAFRSSLMAVLGAFLAMYLGFGLACFAAWQFPESIWFLAAPIWAPLAVIPALAKAWPWIFVLLLGAISLGYAYLPRFRFELILGFAITIMYFSTFLEELPIPWNVGARLAIATVGAAALAAGAYWASPWGYRDPSG